jgi:hypothetical protein
VSATIFTAT